MKRKFTNSAWFPVVKTVLWLNKLPLPLRLLLTAALAAAGGGLIALGAEEGLGPIIGLGCLALGGALATVVLTIAPLFRRLGSAALSAWRTRPRARLAAILLGGGLLLLGGVAAWQKLAWQDIERLCEQARRAPTLEARLAALAEARGAMDGALLFIPPGMLDEYADRRCRGAARELRALTHDQRCPTRPLLGHPCSCGDHLWSGASNAAPGSARLCCLGTGQGARLRRCYR